MDVARAENETTPWRVAALPPVPDARTGRARLSVGGASPMSDRPTPGAINKFWLFGDGRAAVWPTKMADDGAYEPTHSHGARGLVSRPDFPYADGIPGVLNLTGSVAVEGGLAFPPGLYVPGTGEPPPALLEELRRVFPDRTEVAWPLTREDE